MRLRLTVKRHGLPPVQVLWNTEAPQLPNALLGASITISQLLEQVNEVIPLEAEDWGLEDYAIEVDGFECLHFSSLGQVLKDDDEACIRPLQTADLRVRKYSGRHQIASDGKHLIDGVAFGRPYLRRADRPAIRIPPRKRGRYIFDEVHDQCDESDVNDRQLAIRAASDDEDEEGNIFGIEAGEQGMSAELEDLLLAAAEDGDVGDGQAPRQTRSQRRSTKQGPSLWFRGTYSNPLLDMYSQDNTRWTPPSHHVKGSRLGSLQEKSLFKSSRKEAYRRDSTASNKSVHFEDGKSASPATIHDSEESDDEDDEDFDPGDINESDKENLEPEDASQEFWNISDSASTSSSEFIPSDDEDDYTSSSGTSSSSSYSESRAPQSKAWNLHSGADQDDTGASLLGSSSSSTSSSPPGARGIGHSRSEISKKASKEVAAELAQSNEELDSRHEHKSHPAVPPGQGKNATWKRNQRRKLSARLKRLRDNGTLPEGIVTTSDLTQYEELHGRVEHTRIPSSANLPAVQNAQAGDFQSTNEALEVKRSTLLGAIGSAGVGRNPAKPKTDHEEDGNVRSSQKNLHQPSDLVDELHQKTVREGSHNSATTRSLSLVRSDELQQHSETEDGNRNGLEFPKRRNVSTFETSQPATIPLPPSSTNAQSEPGLSPSDLQKQRSRLDLGSSKRLLFGALGLRTPKTKDEESALRDKLMKNIKPLKEPRVSPPNDHIAVTATDLENDDLDNDNWRAKIDLRAVECCHEGVVLSTPPYPFVQRWDPQQRSARYAHRDPKTKRKNKKRKRNDPAYLEPSPASHLPAKVPRQNTYDPVEEQPTWVEPACPKEDESAMDADGQKRNLRDSLAANEQLQRETSASIANASAQVHCDDEDDIPGLPSDLSSLAELKEDDCISGTIIAFKRFIMSADTQWQPHVSDYVTATIENLSPDGTLSLTLARRDRPHHEYEYNQETGERIYGKFEMPGYDNEQANSDDGKLDIAYNELIAPLLVCNSDRPPMSKGQDEGGQSTEPSANRTSLSETIVEDSAQRVTVHEPASLGLDGCLDEKLVHYETSAIAPGEEAREEIMSMIRDAGWRSGLGSGINKDWISEGNTLNSLREAQLAKGGKKILSASQSSLSDEQKPNARPQRSEVLPKQSRSTDETQNPDTEGLDDFVDKRSSDLNAKCSISKQRPTVVYPVLPASNDEEESPSNQRQHRSTSFELEDAIISSQESIFPSSPCEKKLGPDMSSNQVSTVQAMENHSQSDFNDHTALDFDDELPELFSQAFEARMSQQAAAYSEPSSQQSGSSQISKPSTRRQRRAQGSQSPPESTTDQSALKIALESPDSSLEHSQAQTSRLVDLTLPSDPVEPTAESLVEKPTNSHDDSIFEKSKSKGPVRVGRRTTKRTIESR